MKTLRSAALALAFAGAEAAVTSEPARAAEGFVQSLPENPRADCPGSRARLYDECGDQRAVFEEARAVAAAQGKALLVSAGAEWCVWCHVIDATLKGFVDSAAAMEDETLEAQADALRLAASERFVIVHIELDKAPNGQALLEEIGAWDNFQDWIPFLFGVDAEGRYVARLGERDAQTGGQSDANADSDAQTSSDTDAAAEAPPPGYDRRLLRQRLISLADAIERANRR